MSIQFLHGFDIDDVPTSIDCMYEYTKKLFPHLTNDDMTSLMAFASLELSKRRGCTPLTITMGLAAGQIKAEMEDAIRKHDAS